jgi:hypothetical protein
MFKLLFVPVMVLSISFLARVRVFPLLLIPKDSKIVHLFY